MSQGNSMNRSVVTVTCHRAALKCGEVDMRSGLGKEGVSSLPGSEMALLATDGKALTSWRTVSGQAVSITAGRSREPPSPWRRQMIYRKQAVLKNPPHCWFGLVWFVCLFLTYNTGSIPGVEKVALRATEN